MNAAAKLGFEKAMAEVATLKNITNITISTLVLSGSARTFLLGTQDDFWHSTNGKIFCLVHQKLELKNAIYKSWIQNINALAQVRQT